MKTVCIGLFLLICQFAYAARDPYVPIQKLRHALTDEQQAIVSLEEMREKQNQQLHHLQQTLAAQIKAAAKLTNRRADKALLGYHARLARSQIKLIGDIRAAEAANTTLLQQRMAHQHKLKKLLLQALKKSRDTLITPVSENDRETGMLVRAIAHGKVIFAESLRGFGLMVIISHGNGYMSLYGQNTALYAKMGDNVNKSQVIASIGNKRSKSPPERYFELRHNGTPLPSGQNTFILN